jgi:hypothetical protein
VFTRVGSPRVRSKASEADGVTGGLPGFANEPGSIAWDLYRSTGSKGRTATHVPGCKVEWGRTRIWVRTVTKTGKVNGEVIGDRLLVSVGRYEGMRVVF